MMTRLRVVLPPGPALIGFLLVYLLIEGPYLYIEWRMNQRIEIVRPGTYLLRITAIYYGLWRVTAFHPAARPDYRIWLERTPWTSRKPLPAGPIALAWEDLLPLGALAILSSPQGTAGPMTILAIFLGGYLIGLAGLMFTTEAIWFGYALAFGVGLVIRTWPDPRYCLASAVGAYLVGWSGLRASLARFPWPLLEQVTTASILTKKQEDTCGWPFDQLRPTIAEGPKVSRRAGVMLGLLAGWYLFAAESLFNNPANRQLMLQLAFWNAILFLAGGRGVLYCASYAPPINLWGRLRTFRWIVPGYDQVFIAPLCTLLVGTLALDRFRPQGLDDQVFLPAALASGVMVALTTGPSLARWRLTGKHRIVVSLNKKNGEFVQVG